MKLEDIKDLNLKLMDAIEIKFHPEKTSCNTGKVIPDKENIITQLGYYLGVHKISKNYFIIKCQRLFCEGTNNIFHVDEWRKQNDYIISINKFSKD